ncbi:hypothetical protein Ahy_A03g012675 [Arachis hypogaea]|uniref:Uncharacterized protein n=1 Tax=Arachis hypogaea TaxID=3818 RepID=A0A445DTZ3_ARAHY|nr:hypothetical protein Ahy_A03g012675 [Arachis hypogaea]
MFNPNPFLDKLQKELWLEYEGIAVQEEVYWQQMARSKNLNFGDRNTRYFHQRANGRRKRNKITAPKNEAEQWIDDVECLKSWGVSYFKALYSTDSNYSAFPLSGCFPRLLRGDYMDISKEISQKEIRAAIFDMGSWKARTVMAF